MKEKAVSRPWASALRGKWTEGTAAIMESKDCVVKRLPPWPGIHRQKFPGGCTGSWRNRKNN